MKLTQFEESMTERVLIIGMPGTGKSTLAGELSKEFNLHWIDTENGVSTLSKLPAEQKERINVIQIPDTAAFPVACETILQLFKNGKGNICTSHGKYDCALCKKDQKPFNSIDFSTLTSNDIVVVDSATQISNSILAHLMKGKDVTAKPERDDWGGARKHTEYIASQFQGAQFNLVVIAQAVEAELEDGKKKLVPQFGSAVMSASFAKYFGHVIYTDVLNKKHKAYSSSTHSSSIVTKSRTDFRIEDLAEPSLIPLFMKAKSERLESSERKDNVDINNTPGDRTVNNNSGAGDTNSSATAPTLTPAQQALVNLKNRGIK